MKKPTCIHGVLLTKPCPVCMSGAVAMIIGNLKREEEARQK